MQIFAFKKNSLIGDKGEGPAIITESGSKTKASKHRANGN